MKVKYFLLLAILIACTSTLFAKYILWQSKEKPSVSLVDAVGAATKELNKDGADFYCLNASVGITASTCDWEMQFYNKAGDFRSVTVTDEMKVFISKQAIVTH